MPEYTTFATLENRYDDEERAERLRQLAWSCLDALAARYGRSRGLCAVSGGLDSMCLLHLCAAWGKERGVYGASPPTSTTGCGATAADRDEAFVRRLVRRRGTSPLQPAGAIRPVAWRSAEGLSVEEAARKLRYAFLHGDGGGAGAEADSHRPPRRRQRGDHAAEPDPGHRPCWTDGHSAPAGRHLAGPLLDVPPGKSWRPTPPPMAIPHVEDETNADPDAAARNLLRLQVMPLLRQINPRAVGAHERRRAADCGRRTTVLEAGCTAAVSAPVWSAERAA